jgi:protein LSM14
MSTAPAVASQGAVATDATTAAANAVAAAMAKLPQPGAQKKPVQGQPDASLDTVTRKMNEMRPYDGTQAPRGGHQYPRGGRGGARAPHKKIEIPKSDYDFETANAKFNKQEVDDSATHNQYNRTSSFFDNISSEARDREENSTGRLGGREWRGEEEKRNIETFGQGSVDGYGRGRGRGRGRGFGRGRGYRGGYGGRGRGGRPPSQSTGIPSQV